MKRILRRFIFFYQEFIFQNTGTKRVVFWFALTYLLYSVLLFVVICDLMKYTGGNPVFNIMPFGYSNDYVNSLLLRMGERGRHAYLYHLIPIDLFFPFLFAYSNFILTGYLLGRLDALRGGFIYLCLLPVFASWFDYLENLGVMAMLINYPLESNALIQFSDFFSVAKSLLITVYICILATILFFIWRRKKSLFDR